MSALHTQEATGQLAVPSPRQTKRLFTVLVGASILAAAVTVAISVNSSSRPEAAEITFSKAQTADAARWQGLAQQYSNPAVANGIEHGPFTAYVPDLRTSTEPLYVGQDANLDPDIPLFAAPGLPAGVDWGWVSQIVSGNASVTPSLQFGETYPADYGSSGAYAPDRDGGETRRNGNKSVIAD